MLIFSVVEDLIVRRHQPPGGGTTSVILYDSQRQTRPLRPTPVSAWRSDGAHHDGGRRGMSCRSELPLVLERWRRFRRALKAPDQPAMDIVIAALEKNGPATFAGLDDPLEAAVLAVLIELAREEETDAPALMARCGA